jgi:Xaa-Pro aminopeptidase
MHGEYRSRYERLQALMAVHGLSAIIVTSNPNYLYFTGHSTWAWSQKSRPLVAIMHAEEEPMLVIPEMDIENAKRQSWIRKRIVWKTLPFDSSIITRSMNVKRGAKIGLEYGAESRIGLTVADLRKLERQLRTLGASLVDASGLIWTLRSIKSRYEVDLIEKSAKIMSRAYRNFFEKLDRPFTARRMASILGQEMLREGADCVGFVIIGFLSGFLPDKQFEPGSLIRIDAGSIYNGYWSDFSRSAVIGIPKANQEKNFRIARGILHRCLERIREGSMISTLATLAQAEMRRAGLPGNVTGRVGHGIGLDITEPPSIAMWEKSSFRRNMTLALEPVRFYRGNELYHVEENLLVTGDGVRLLSEPDEILHSIR